MYQIIIFMPSLFAKVELAPADPILQTAAAYKADTHPKKVNLGIGAYRTEEGKPWVLPVVRKAEDLILEETHAGKIDKEYCPIDGVPGVQALCQKLIFGESGDRIATAQTLSGTGALRVCAAFMKKYLGFSKIYVSDPTWGNHPACFQTEGLAVEYYPYWNAETRSLKFEQFLAHVKSAPNGSAYLLHACAHNPTGVDPTVDQWKQIMAVFKEKGHVPVIDSAYQGYASGSLEKDREVVEMFFKAGMEMFLCQSFAKNLGLYGERMGCFHVVCDSVDDAKRVLSQVKMVIRPMYSSPPIHGGLLTKKILGDPALYEQWKKELKFMADRILEMRSMLRAALEKLGTPGTWNHVTDQIGMFSFTGLTKPMSERMVDMHHIYMLKSGRISIAGLNRNNVQYVAECIDEVTRWGLNNAKL